MEGIKDASSCETALKGVLGPQMVWRVSEGSVLEGEQIPVVGEWMNCSASYDIHM